MESREEKRRGAEGRKEDGWRYFSGQIGQRHTFECFVQSSRCESCECAHENEQQQHSCRAQRRMKTQIIIIRRKEA